MRLSSLHGPNKTRHGRYAQARAWLLWLASSFTAAMFLMQIATSFNHPTIKLWCCNDTRDAHEKSSRLTSLPGLIIAANTYRPSSLHSTTDIAIGCAITARSFNLRTTSVARITTVLPLFRTFLPSFCKTATKGHHYHFYIAHDREEEFFLLPHVHKSFEEAFWASLQRHCPAPRTFKTSVRFIVCNHSGMPARAQSDAMMAAYLDNMPFFYRVNDDTIFETANWTEAFVRTLKGNQPPNIGVVGPNHRNGNMKGLTYDFVHRSHMDIFGSYYPRVFTGWFADEWISEVYRPGRMHKLHNIRVTHTMEKGRRYGVRMALGKFLQPELDSAKSLLREWLQAKNATSSSSSSSSSSSKSSAKSIISFTLYGNVTKYLYGAIRNAQLAHVYFPNWTVRFYVEKPWQSPKFGAVPIKVLNKLQVLGAQVHYIDTKMTALPPVLWRFFVADDQNCDRFLVRDADGRLSRRDARAVNTWLESGFAVHCMRDHPDHVIHPIWPGTFGANTKPLRAILQRPVTKLMTGYNSDIVFMDQVAWPKLEKYMVCHDSVACHVSPNSRPFPGRRIGFEHVGQSYEAYGETYSSDIDTLRTARLPRECTTG